MLPLLLQRWLRECEESQSRNIGVQWRVCCFKKKFGKKLLTKMNFVKRKATTKKSKFSVSNFEELKSQFLMDIMASVTMEEIPSDMVLNWDQTAIKYIPLSDWTMAQKGSKRMEVFGIDDKRQITAMFAASLSGNFLPIQLVYEGKTSRCHPCRNMNCE